MTNTLPSAQLEWSDPDTAFSARFGDIYRSRTGAVDETRHVFLGGCGLPEAWRGRTTFTIAETGFGTALNFTATLEAWRKTADAGARLHYIAVEGYPLTPDELAACIARRGELSAAGEALRRVYPVAQPGFHRLFLNDDRVVLTLLFGDVREMLRALEANVDAWFLDGFAPDRNPEMWSAEVLADVARLSRPGARLATYTIAGQVRRGLTDVGFDVAKAPGFGAKRDMLCATFVGPAQPSRLMPWFARPPVMSGGRALIIGGGLAGTHAADALNRRGWATTIIERHGTLAADASGNSVGVLMPRLTAAPNTDGRFYAAAWRFMLDRLGETEDAGYARCGVLQLDDDERARTIATAGGLPSTFVDAVDRARASELAGLPLPRGGVYFPQGGWLDPRRLCAALARRSEVRLGTTVAAAAHDGSGWTLLDPGGGVIARGDVAIVASALHATQMDQLARLPLSGRRGQISFAAASPASAHLKCVVSYGGYITPAADDAHCIGATFDWTRDPLGVQSPAPEDDARNLADLAQAWPSLAVDLPGAMRAARAAVRCTTPDHLPVAGPVPDWAAFEADYAELRHGHAWARYPEARYQPGLYVLAGLGSRGLVAAPLAAELLACQITGEPWPLPRDLADALHPGRFLIRDLRRLK